MFNQKGDTIKCRQRSRHKANKRSVRKMSSSNKLILDHQFLTDITIDNRVI